MADRPSSAGGTRTPTAPVSVPEPRGADNALVEEDLVVEEISIDGMCGVY